MTFHWVHSIGKISKQEPYPEELSKNLYPSKMLNKLETHISMHTSSTSSLPIFSIFINDIRILPVETSHSFWVLMFPQSPRPTYQQSPVSLPHKLPLKVFVPFLPSPKPLLWIDPFIIHCCSLASLLSTLSSSFTISLFPCAFGYAGPCPMLHTESSTLASIGSIGC